MLQRIDLPSSIDRIPVSPRLRSWITESNQRIEAFQDRWDQPMIEQFVAADYELVYQTLAWILEAQPTIGRRFLEWGCGFAVVSTLASKLNLDVVGIEAEEDLLREGRKTVTTFDASVDLIHGNFLPPGSESLADDPMLPSLGHDVPDAYEILEMDLDDFAFVYAYPWPGEDDFHEAVFDRYAATGALLILFCGPNQMRVLRKTR